MDGSAGCRLQPFPGHLIKITPGNPGKTQFDIKNRFALHKIPMVENRRILGPFFHLNQAAVRTAQVNNRVVALGREMNQIKNGIVPDQRLVLGIQKMLLNTPGQECIKPTPGQFQQIFIVGINGVHHKSAQQSVVAVLRPDVNDGHIIAHTVAHLAAEIGLIKFRKGIFSVTVAADDADVRQGAHFLISEYGSSGVAEAHHLQVGGIDNENISTADMKRHAAESQPPVAHGVGPVGPVIHKSGQNHSFKKIPGVDFFSSQEIYAKYRFAFRTQIQFVIIQVGQNVVAEILQHPAPAQTHCLGGHIWIGGGNNPQDPLESCFGKTQGGSKIVGEITMPIGGTAHHRLGQQVGQIADRRGKRLGHEKVKIKGDQTFKKLPVTFYAQGFTG